ncbi:MAG: Rne/Rng family ribonuclease [Alphaproteobacteria bacterium]|jgi:ribonuclease E|nr:Rne/Rng family ribonuclease [Alphaproteobacteria bacterium]
MSKLMLIDAVHPEETRVALATNEQVDDFDFETTGKEQLRGNIYLAKVTRVEPSLQAAFVEYGGNRHGFLAFSEIHPDYYQLPQEDREALLKEAAEAAAEVEGLDPDEDDEDEIIGEGDDDDEGVASDEAGDDDVVDLANGDDNGPAAGKNGSAGETAAKQPQRRRRAPRNTFLKKYKIQEVIRRRQVMLVQVVKEERGNKGAALTTYLSLAGRYSVLMPNTPRGGGISRKIANGTDRKRLKTIMSELEVPSGMGLIVRTAGAKRTKTEIKRDYDYLIKLWDTIREKTLNSMAPCLINEEGGLVHRAMRDMFDKDIEEVLIEGDEAYREAKGLAKILMPSQAKKVKQWKEPSPLFVAEGIEEQLDSIFSPEVKLKSGGYLIINQTEALVAIDVNSGKSTRARNIEQTALQTNMEAAEEACRQMRLRDLAGLIVIDFIDMDENKNNRAVEKKLKDCLKIDRSRVQAGRISQFGLMEISRQRRRAGFLQATSDPCPTCKGTGRVRSVPSAALQLIRSIQARCSGGGLKSLTVEAPTEVALYLLNHKRENVAAVEEEAGFAITITSSESLMPGEFTMEAEKDPNARKADRKRRRPRVRDEKAAADTSAGLEVIDAEEPADAAEPVEAEKPAEGQEAASGEDDDDGEAPKRKSRRRGRRGGRRRRRRDESAAQEETTPAGEITGSDDKAEETRDRPTPPKVRQTRPDPVPQDGGAFLDGLSLTPGEVLDTALPTDSGKDDAARAEPVSDETGQGYAGDASGDAQPDAEAGPSTAEVKAQSGPVDDVDAAKPAPADEKAPAAVPQEEEPADSAKPDTDQEKPSETVAHPPEAANEDDEKSQDQKPRRRGWWNRRRA